MALLDLILWNSCTFIVIADFIESVKFLLVNGVVADHAQGCILLQGNSFSRPSSRHEHFTAVTAWQTHRFHGLCIGVINIESQATCIEQCSLRMLSANTRLHCSVC